MNRFLFYKFLLFSFALSWSPSASAQVVSPCQVFGNIYFTEHKQEAQIWVYEEDSEGLAELIVYEEENELFADQAGLWHETNRKEFADYRVFITDNPDEAHFRVFFTDEPEYAGCQD